MPEERISRELIESIELMMFCNAFSKKKHSTFPLLCRGDRFFYDYSVYISYCLYMPSWHLAHGTTCSKKQPVVAR